MFEVEPGAFDWLEGRWVGERDGAPVVETWGPVEHGFRQGVFHIVEDGAPSMFAWLLLGSFEGRTQMRIKHFSAAAVGFEDKDAWTEFTLERLDDQRAVFAHSSGPAGRRVVYERVGDEMWTWFCREDETRPSHGVFAYRQSA